MYYCKYYEGLCWHIDNPTCMCMQWYRGYSEIYDYSTCKNLYKIPTSQIEDVKYLLNNSYVTFTKVLLQYLLKHPTKNLSQKQKDKLIQSIQTAKLEAEFKRKCFGDQGNPEYFGHN